MSDFPSLAPGTAALAGGIAGANDATSSASSSVQGTRPSGSWFEGMGTGRDIGLQAACEPQARGLSASEHAQRVLQHLVEVG